MRRLPPESRSKYIEDHNYIWREIKSELEKLSDNKCWYCDFNYVRSDFDVDHFRPKNKLKDFDDPEQESEGYWWLAFDHKNFRLSCNYCNRPHKGEDDVTRGKAMFFPLCNGTQKCPEQGDIDTEERILLDPTDPLDPGFLWFNEEGRAVPAFDKGYGKYHERAAKTLDILNLNDCQIKEQRRLIKNECDSIIKEGDSAYRLFESRNPEGEILLREVLRRARNLIDDSSPLSSVARIYLLSGNSNNNRPWIDKILKHI